MYRDPAHSATSSGSPSSLLNRILDYVDEPRRTSDGMATISREFFRGDGLRFSFHNRYSVHISVEYLWEYLDELDPKKLGGDLIPSLAACVARDGYHAHGGKDSFCVPFYEWMAADDYRTCRLERLAADLPFAIYSEQHGWGFVVRPPHGGEDHCLSMHSSWYMVWYAHGLECRTIIPDEDATLFFTWDAVRKYVREEREWHLSRRQAYACPESWRYDWKPDWRLIYKMWG
jgi:hypothetical protein